MVRAADRVSSGDIGSPGGDSGDRLEVHRVPLAGETLETVKCWDAITDQEFEVRMPVLLLAERLGIKARSLGDIQNMRSQGALFGCGVGWAAGVALASLAGFYFQVDWLMDFWSLILAILPAVFLGLPLGWLFGPLLWERVFWTAKRYYGQQEQVIIEPITYQRFIGLNYSSNGDIPTTFQSTWFYNLYSNEDIRQMWQEQKGKWRGLKAAATLGIPLIAMGIMVAAALLLQK